MELLRWLKRGGRRSDPAAAVVVLNRHERRARGIKDPVGLLPIGVEAPRETFVPRYVLRNAAKYFADGRTRRQRRIRARTRRIMVALGYPAGTQRRSV